MNFQIGQKVVCIRPFSTKSKHFSDGDIIPMPLIVGQVYVVGDIEFCIKCGTQYLHMGTHSDFCETAICGICGHISPANTTKDFHNSKRFVPLEEYEASEKMVEELLEPIKEKV